MKRKVKRPFDNEQFRKGYVAGIFAAEKELNTKLLHFAEKAHKIMSEGTFPDYGVKINFKDSNNTIATNLDMKTEEKAKRYDEALEWMREVYPTLTGAAKEDAEHYFPELKESKESEDEKIRKEIINFLKSEKAFQIIDMPISERWIAYLEKQKEQIPYIDFVIKPHKGDDTNPYDMGVSEAQDYATHRGFDIPFNDGEVYVDERHITQTVGNILRWADEHPKEQKPSINIDQLKSLMLQYLQEAANKKEDSNIEADTDKWARKILGYDFEQKPSEWSEEDKAMIDDIIFSLPRMANGSIEILPSVAKSYSERLKSLKDRGNFPKSNTNSPSEWSEEDEKMQKNIIWLLEVHPSYRKEVDWLKSLRPQPHWEPTKEQMEYLSKAIVTLGEEGDGKTAAVLNELRKDLKNL